MAKSMGLTRIWSFETMNELENGFDEAFCGNADGHRFVVLEVDPFTSADHEDRKTSDGWPEIKFRFGRYIEKTYGARVFTGQF